MIKQIIFDLDGTLIDSSKDIIECLESAYLEYGMKIKVPKKLIGLPLREMIQTLTPNFEKIELVILCFRKMYDNSSYSKTVLCEGIEKILPILPNCYLVTNKPIIATTKLLSKFNLQFKEIICIDSFKHIQNPTKISILGQLMNNKALCPVQTILIGDTETDVDAARVNNIDCIIVTNGYGNKRKIAELNPYRMCYSLNEVYTILREEIQ